MMFTQTTEILIQLLHTLLMSFDTFALEPLMQLSRKVSFTVQQSRSRKSPSPTKKTKRKEKKKKETNIPVSAESPRLSFRPQSSQAHPTPSLCLPQTSHLHPFHFLAPYQALTLPLAVSHPLPFSSCSSSFSSLSVLR